MEHHYSISIGANALIRTDIDIEPRWKCNLAKRVSNRKQQEKKINRCYSTLEYKLK